MLLEASHCRYEHLHDPPGPSGSNASTHQWPCCPLRLLSNSILGGNSPESNERINFALSSAQSSGFFALVK
jgi:hypothetical protein